MPPSLVYSAFFSVAPAPYASPFPRPTYVLPASAVVIATTTFSGCLLAGSSIGPVYQVCQ